MSEKIETAEFYLSAPRYLQQVGDYEPQYVAASPSNPIKVVLPAKIVRKGEVLDQPEDGHLKRVKQSAPKDSVRPGAKAPPVKKANEAFSAPVKASGESGRAADK